jgi:hypothetical protein
MVLMEELHEGLLFEDRRGLIGTDEQLNKNGYRIIQKFRAVLSLASYCMKALYYARRLLLLAEARLRKRL